LRKEMIAAGLLVFGLAGMILGMWHLESVYRKEDRGVLLTAEVPNEGGWKPRIIHARIGQVLRLRLTSKDVTHGFLLPEFGINSGPISPGEFTTIEFVPHRKGTFTFYCNVLCSPHHGAMNGRLVVDD
jgi:heme/copper-type cytochrome/quinol oxidase subunit 2